MPRADADRVPVWERAAGLWQAIFPKLDLKPEFLTGKNGPCPFCGGKDRWRFIDRDGSGNWICNQCGKGAGMQLAMRLMGTEEFAIVAKRIEDIIRDLPKDVKAKPRIPEVSREGMRYLWNQTIPIGGTPGERYFERRGLEAPRVLRYMPRCWYTPAQAFPAIVAKVTSPAGEAVNLYRVFITAEGEKAPVDKPKKMMRARVNQGCAIRLAESAPHMGVAEGIENAQAAMQLFGIPTWATFGTEFMERVSLPEAVHTVTIFGDNDANFSGQKAAYTLAKKLALEKRIVNVMIPEMVGLDWNDVLRQRQI